MLPIGKGIKRRFIWWFRLGQGRDQVLSTNLSASFISIQTCFFLLLY